MGWLGCLRVPRMHLLLRRFQVPADEDAPHLQSAYDDGADGETQAR